MLKIKEENLQYIYQNNEKTGVIMDIPTFEAVMGVLEDYEGAMDFESLKNEETTEMGRFEKLKIFLDKASPWIAILVVLVAAVGGAYLNHTFHEKETYSKLQLSFVDCKVNYPLTNNNNTENLMLEPVITLYNSKRSDYPDRVVPVKSQIQTIDDGEIVIVANGVGGLENSIVLPGDPITVRSSVFMELNKTGNYTIQITVEYLDVKSGEANKIEFHEDFYVYSSDGWDKELYPYTIGFEGTGVFNERWHIGKKYDI
ncbi:MAG: hypothetical protein KAT13_04225 [Methanosarcinales archaeon]|nr:hypothetical protein [Methanosarcinales archaeon]